MEYLNVGRATNSASGQRGEYDDVSIELVTSRACSSESVYGSLLSSASKMDEQVITSYQYLREDGRYLHAAPQDLSKVSADFCIAVLLFVTHS